MKAIGIAIIAVCLLVMLWLAGGLFLDDILSLEDILDPLYFIAFLGGLGVVVYGIRRLIDYVKARFEFHIEKCESAKTTYRINITKL